MASTPIWLAAGSAACVSVAQTLAIAFAGGVLARTRLSGGRASVKDITTCVVWFFGPCLTISRLTDTLTLESLLQLWLLPTFSVVIVLMGAAIGAAMCALMRVHSRHAPVVICCCACGNALALPLSISQALAVNVDWISASSGSGGPSLITYCFVYTVTDALILFGPVNFILGWQPARATNDGVEAATDGDACNEGTSLIEGGLQHDEVAANRSGSVVGQLARSCVNPMLVASVASVLLSLVEPLRLQFVGSAVWQTMRTAGDATTPLMLANLGAGMALQVKSTTHDAESTTTSTQHTRLSRNLVVAVLLGRLVVTPVATVAVLAAAVRVGLIPATERLLLLFLLMQGATPSAMFLGVMTQMHRDAEREAIMSQLLLVLNIAAIPLFTAAVWVFLTICEPSSDTVFALE